MIQHPDSRPARAAFCQFAAAMASKSRFFAESESESEEEVQEVQETAKKVGGRFKVMDEESSDDDADRVVRSEKDKKFDALLVIVTAIKNSLRNADFPSLQDGASLPLPTWRPAAPRPAARAPPPSPPPSHIYPVAARAPQTWTSSSARRTSSLRSSCGRAFPASTCAS